MKLHDIIQFTSKISLEYGFTKEKSYDKALQIIEECPILLQQNVPEWSENKKLSDIYIGKYSLPMIMEIWDSRDFLRVMEVMIELSKGNLEIAEQKIWNMRR